MGRSIIGRIATTPKIRFIIDIGLLGISEKPAWAPLNSSLSNVIGCSLAE
jgi:hypothetical protein